MSDFFNWFTTGFSHIADLNGYDHILYLVVLCSLYTLKHWKNLLVLITAFTIGHSFTLALSTVRILNINAVFVEFLIPLTIIFTCIYNIRHRNSGLPQNFRLNYWIAMVFGLVHGLGFSTLLRSLLGRSENILSPLFAFNIGLEAGQLIIVIIVIGISVVLTSLFRLRRNDLIFFVSAAVFGIAFVMATERFMLLIGN